MTDRLMEWNEQLSHRGERRDRCDKRIVMTSKLTSIGLFTLPRVPQHVCLHHPLCASVYNCVLPAGDKRTESGLCVLTVVLETERAAFGD
jgi:hypothetical protein